MVDSPLPLAELIGYVTAQHPGADALTQVADAVLTSAALTADADALVGHFVTAARGAGASWSQIGVGLGVSKQAAQQRFVPRTVLNALLPEGTQAFSRFTARARATVSAADTLARANGADAISAGHLAVGLLSQPEGLAAIVITDLGVREGQLLAAFGLRSAADTPDRLHSLDALADLAFDATAEAVLRNCLVAALRAGHNYLGTEHILLGLLGVEEIAVPLGRLGITREYVEPALQVQYAAVKAARQGA